MRMRAIVFVLGLALSGLALFAGKMQLDRMPAHADVAVRAGEETYFIPARVVRTEGWQTDLMRAAGCWDARDAAIISGIQTLAGCDKVRRVSLALPISMLGLDVAMVVHKPVLAMTFWPVYEPPIDEVAGLMEAWGGKGAWAGRRSVLRADWQLWRLETPGSEWVYLLANAPQKGDEAELSRLYAGRCYRPEKESDAGMTCNFALRAGTSAVMEFALSADEMMSFAALREALMARASEWRRGPGTAISGSFAPSA